MSDTQRITRERDAKHECDALAGQDPFVKVQLQCEIEEHDRRVVNAVCVYELRLMQHAPHVELHGELGVPLSNSRQQRCQMNDIVHVVPLYERWENHRESYQFDPDERRYNRPVAVNEAQLRLELQFNIWEVVS